MIRVYFEKPTENRLSWEVKCSQERYSDWIALLGKLFELTHTHIIYIYIYIYIYTHTHNLTHDDKYIFKLINYIY